MATLDELLVCLEANGSGQSDVALGNIIGSNICNIALILGVAALMKPTTCSASDVANSPEARKALLVSAVVKQVKFLQLSEKQDVELSVSFLKFT